MPQWSDFTPIGGNHESKSPVYLCLIATLQAEFKCAFLKENIKETDYAILTTNGGPILKLLDAPCSLDLLGVKRLSKHRSSPVSEHQN